MKYIYYLAIVISFASCRDNKTTLAPQTFGNKIQFYYLIPADFNYESRVFNSLKLVIDETQKWYQVASGGATFGLFEQEFIKIIYLKEPLHYYSNDYWAEIHKELVKTDILINEYGIINFMFLSGASSLDTDDPSIIGLGSGGCNYGRALVGTNTILTPGGVQNIEIVLHELGHAIGLEHPLEKDDLPVSKEDSSMLYSIMCQKNIRIVKAQYSQLGLLTFEKDQIRNSMFFKDQIQIQYNLYVTKHINYPSTGELPLAAFYYAVDKTKNEVNFSNISKGGNYYLWQFGDGSTSVEKNPKHKYSEKKNYQVILTVSSKNHMTSHVSDVVYLE